MQFFTQPPEIQVNLLLKLRLTVKRDGDGRDTVVTCRGRMHVRIEEVSRHNTLTRVLGRRRAQKAAVVREGDGGSRAPLTSLVSQSFDLSADRFDWGKTVGTQGQAAEARTSS